MNPVEKNMMLGMISILNEASYAYYSGNPIMSDSTFDARLKDLQELENETGIIYSNSPSINVGAKVLTDLPEVEHNHLMLSLEKVHTPQEIIDFSNGKELVASIKMDGCFTKDTQILMSDGTYKNIIDVQEGDFVKSFDENTKKICDKKVLRKFYNGKKEFNEWNRIYTNESRYLDSNPTSHRHMLNCTKNHKIFTKNGWLESGDLSKDDEIYAYNYVLSDTQKDFMLGILLGDGVFVDRSIHYNSNKREIHYSKVNKNNYEIMIDKTKELFEFNNPFISKRKSGYGSNMIDINLHGIVLPDYFCNPNNILRCGLTFTEETCNRLSPLALAILYIDDGSKHPSIEDGYKNTFNQKVRCSIATNRHKIENVEIFSRWLNKHGYSNTITFEKPTKDSNLGDGYKINLTVDGTEKFFDDICKYIPKCLRQKKLGLKDKWQNAEEIKWEKDFGEYGLVPYKINNTKIGNRERYGKGVRNRKSFCDAYDLEIEDTHTYFAEGICVHNCTASLLYENGVFVRGESRGNGYVGSDITEHIKQFLNVPMTINKVGTYIIDGECVITDEDFAEINKNNEHKNSRNLIAGTLSSLDTSVVSQRKAKFIAWDIIDGGSSKNLKDNLNEANELGFTVVPFWSAINLEEKKLQNTLDYIFEYAKEDGYPNDGIVFKFNDIEYGKSLGKTEHHFKSGIAYKKEDDTVRTELIDIDWTVGKSGQITPTAVFRPVELLGSTVERASVHNVSILSNLDLHIGDTIEIVKANAVIPQVKRNVSADKREALGKEPDYIIIPSICPVCGGHTEIKQDNDSKVLVCTNDRCSGKLLGKLTHFVSKNAINIDGLSESTLEKFIELGWLTCFEDIYKLKSHASEMMNLEGFGEKSVKKLLKSIEMSRDTTLDRFIYALSIPLIGHSASKTISKYFNGDFDRFYNECVVHNFDYRVLDGFGEAIAESIDNYLNENCFEIGILSRYMNFEKPNVASGGANLSGLTFCITGSLNHFANRDEAKEKIKISGGKVSGSVSAKTNYLVSNDINSTSGKNKKALELGVKIITEDELIEMLNN